MKKIEGQNIDNVQSDAKNIEALTSLALAMRKRENQSLIKIKPNAKNIEALVSLLISDENKDGQGGQKEREKIKSLLTQFQGICIHLSHSKYEYEGVNDDEIVKPTYVLNDEKIALIKNHLGKDWHEPLTFDDLLGLYSSNTLHIIKGIGRQSVREVGEMLYEKKLLKKEEILIWPYLHLCLKGFAEKLRESKTTVSEFVRQMDANEHLKYLTKGTTTQGRNDKEWAIKYCRRMIWKASEGLDHIVWGEG